MLHIRRYLAALAAFSAAFCAYAYGVAPLMEPPSIGAPAAVGGATPVAVSPDLRADLARLFAPGSWELKNPIVVEAEQCTLIVQEYLPTPDGRLELKPCTVIFYTKAPAIGRDGAAAAGARRPVVLQAPEGAMLQFDRPLDIARGQFGKVIGGRLEGLVTISSPPTTPDGNDALRLTTRNVQLDQNKIFTPHEVEFRYGETYGKGRDLTIALVPEDEKAIVPLAAKSNGNIQSLTLARIDTLHIAPSRGVQPARPRSSTPPKSEDDEAPLEISCRGPFVLDMMQQVAAFDDQVVVLRLAPGGPPDRLRCDRLLIELAPQGEKRTNQIAADTKGASASAATKPGPAADNNALAGRVERIIALGSPATLDAPSRAASASAARMEYSLLKQRIVLVPGPNVPQVSLRQAGQHFTARELEYEFAEGGRLGKLWAAGPGELKAIQTRQAATQTIVARWEQELRIRPQDQNQVVSLLGNASVTVDPMGRFDAEELHLWLLEVSTGAEVVEPSATGPQRLPPLRAAAAVDAKPKYTIQPARVLATGGVRLTSVQLDAEAARLEAWFMNVPAAPVAPLRELPPIDRAPVAVQPTALLRGDPRVSKGAAPQHLPKPPSLQKFHVNGELVQLQLVVRGRELELEDLLIRTHALIEETRTPEPGQEPIRIRGDSIELRHGTTAQAKMIVSGKPAEVGGRGMSLAGNEVNVHRGENRMWIDGPGEATLPVPDEQSLPLAPLGAGPVREPRPPARPAAPGQPLMPAEKMHLVWQQGLNFDGQTVRLSGGVEARTATQVATAQTLDATLTVPIDFAATDTRPIAELGRLHLDGGVYLLNQGRDEFGQKITHDQMQVKNLTFDRTAGTLNADGPGWVSTVRKTEGLPGAPGPAGAIAPPAAAAGAPEQGPDLTSIYIAFERRIEGKLADRSITFRHNVRTTYSPAADFIDRIIATRPEDLLQQRVLMTSDALTMTEMLTPASRWVEIQATGNTLVEGQSFTVRAAKVGYTSDKEVMTVEGDGRADAQVWYQTTPGQPRSYTSARKFRYWLRDGAFEGEDFSVLDLQQLGNLKFGGPRR